MKKMNSIFNSFGISTGRKQCPVCKECFTSNSKICPKCGMMCGNQTEELEYKNYKDIIHKNIEINDNDNIDLKNKYSRAYLANYYVPSPSIDNISNSKTVLFCHDECNDSWAIGHALEIEKIAESINVKPIFGFSKGKNILLPKTNDAYISLWNCGADGKFEINRKKFDKLSDLEKYEINDFLRKYKQIFPYTYESYKNFLHNDYYEMTEKEIQNLSQEEKVVIARNCNVHISEILDQLNVHSDLEKIMR